MDLNKIISINKKTEVEKKGKIQNPFSSWFLCPSLANSSQTSDFILPNFSTLYLISIGHRFREEKKSERLMESLALWQGVTLTGILSWILISSYLKVTDKVRSLFQPWVTHHVIIGTPLIIKIQVFNYISSNKQNPDFSLIVCFFNW